MPTKVIIADDHPLILDGIKELLKNNPDYQIIGIASSLGALISLLKTPSDILILDLNMHKESSLSKVKDIRSIQPKLKILIFTSYNTPSLVRKAFKNEVNGYLLKDSSEEDLIQALEGISKGQKYIGKNVKMPKRNFLHVKEALTDFEDEFIKKSNLTKREKQIAELIVEGLDNQAIGEKLFISPNTVHSHRKKVFKKLNVHSAAELIKLFMNRK